LTKVIVTLASEYRRYRLPATDGPVAAGWRNVPIFFVRGRVVIEALWSSLRRVRTFRSVSS